MMIGTGIGGLSLRWIAARLVSAVTAIIIAVSSTAFAVSADSAENKDKTKNKDTDTESISTETDSESEDEEVEIDEEDASRDRENFHRNGAWGYTVLADDTAAICKYYGDSKHPGVPSEIDGHTVTALSGGWLLNGTGELLLYGNIHGVTYNEDGSINGSSVYSPFSKNNSIVEITLPDSVRFVGAIAFKGCKKLKKVKFGKNVELIGNNCFEGCKALEEVSLPDTVTYIDQEAFKDCTSLSQLSMPGAHCEGAVFQGCTALGEVSLGVMDSVPQYMFSGCTGLTEVTIPDGVSSVGDSAFAGCTALTSVSLPDSVTAVYNNAFSGCTSLTQVRIGAKTDTIGARAFADCPIKNFFAPETLVRIGEAAFGMTADGVPLEGFVLTCPQYSAAQSYAEKYSLALETTEPVSKPAESYEEPSSEMLMPVELADDDAVFKITLAALGVTALAVVIAIILMVKNRGSVQPDDENEDYYEDDGDDSDDDNDYIGEDCDDADEEEYEDDDGENYGVIGKYND